MRLIVSTVLEKSLALTLVPFHKFNNHKNVIIIKRPTIQPPEI